MLLCRTALRRVVVYEDPELENLLLDADLNIFKVVDFEDFSSEFLSSEQAGYLLV